MNGEVMEADTRPTRMSKAPDIPDSVSEKLYGDSICVRREDIELKKPT